MAVGVEVACLVMPQDMVEAGCLAMDRAVLVVMVDMATTLAMNLARAVLLATTANPVVLAAVVVAPLVLKESVAMAVSAAVAVIVTAEKGQSTPQDRVVLVELAATPTIMDLVAMVTVQETVVAQGWEAPFSSDRALYSWTKSI